MPGFLVRTSARPLLERFSCAEPGALAVLVGVGGTGKSVVIDQIETRRSELGLVTMVLNPRTDPDGLGLDQGEQPLLIVEDAHLLTDEGMDRLLRLAEQRHTRKPGLLIAFRPVDRPGPSRLQEITSDRDQLVRLGAFGVEEVAALCHAFLDSAPPSRLVDRLLEVTGGQPLLLERVARALLLTGDRGRVDQAALASLPGLGSRSELARDAIASRVGQLDREDRAVLGALACAARPALTSSLVSHHPSSVERLRLAGLAPPEGPMPQLAASTVLGCLHGADLSRAQALVTSALLSSGAGPVTVAEHLWENGIGVQDHVATFVAAGDYLLDSDADDALRWYQRARALSPDDQDAGAGNALALLLGGQAGEAAALAMQVLRRGPHQRALAVTACAYAFRGLWPETAHAAGSLSAGSGWWSTIVAICEALVSPPDGVPRQADADDPLSRVLEEAGDALRAAVRPDADGAALARLPEAIRHLRRLLEDFDVPPEVPITPHELGAVAALAVGELRLARSILLLAPLITARRPHLDQLLRWVDVRLGAEAGHDDGLRVSTTQDGSVLALAIDAALARRAGDVNAGSRLARRLAAVTATADPDLLMLDGAAELLVLARRFRVGNVTEEFGERVGRFLERMGHPPLWSARLAWCDLEAAAGVRDIEMVRLRAAELAELGSIVPGLRPLVLAAEVWPGVLESKPDIEAVRLAVSELRDSGYVWEAARLAGQAAIRAENPEQAKALLGEARSLRANQRSEIAIGEDQITPAGLSEREIEVAEKVLNGMSYKDIGSTLYISAKTVEHHVAHIRRKLGVTGGNRAEFLASLKEDLGLDV